MSTRRWRLVHKDAEKGSTGHRLFVDEAETVEPGDVPRIYVADDSGRTPDRCYQGPIEVCLTGLDEIVLEPFYRYLVAKVPVLLGPGGRERGSVLLSAGCAVYLARAGGCSLAVSAPYIGSPIHLETGG